VYLEGAAVPREQRKLGGATESVDPVSRQLGPKHLPRPLRQLQSRAGAGAGVSPPSKKKRLGEEWSEWWWWWWWW